MRNAHPDDLPVHLLGADGAERRPGPPEVPRRRRRVGAVFVGAALVIGVALLPLVRDEDPPPATEPPIVVFDARGLDERVVLVAGGRSTSDQGRVAVLAGGRVVAEHDSLPLHAYAGRNRVQAVGDRIVWREEDLVVSLDLETGAHDVIGTTHAGLLPAVEPDGVWLVFGDLRTAIEVDAEGRETDRIAFGETASEELHREVEGGILGFRLGTAVSVRDADGRDDRAHVQGLRAASARHVVSADGSLVDLGAPDDAVALGVDVARAAFTVDGDLLAVVADVGTPRASLQLVDVATGEVLQRHALESVDDPGPLVWSPDGDAVYLLDRDGERSRRVIGVAVGGAPQTVARFGPGGEGYRWLAVLAPPSR